TYVADPIPAKGGMGDFSTDYQKMHIYVSERATKDSPIILMVNNGGWMPSALSHKITNEGEYASDSDTDVIGAALDAGYVIVNMGTRSRGLKDEAGNYVGHSPAVVTDVKAGIRYLRYNAGLGLLPAGNTDRIIVTGTSGGGGLSVAVAASGNSPDYYPYLYEIGAAGVSYDNDNGSYTSTINDDVFATVAYCPITDFDHADQAYEWTYYETRGRLKGETVQDSVYAKDYPVFADEVMAASAELKAAYPAYVNDLGLKLEDGKKALTADNFEDAIIALLEKEVEEAYVKRGKSLMEGDLQAYEGSNPPRGALVFGTNSPDWVDDIHAWYSIDESGKATIDYDKLLYFVARNTELKTTPAFSNYGTPHQHFMNEDNLFGALPTQEYSPFEFWSWNNHSAVGAAVYNIGKNNTGSDWDDYLSSEYGKILKQQMKMVNPIPYLIDDNDGDSAPYWYVRHGMRDRDTSFAVEALLYYAMINDSSIRDVNFKFAWLQGHGGNYDVQEAYEWTVEIINIAEAFDDVTDAMPKSGARVTGNFQVPVEASGVDIKYSSSHPNIVKIEDDGAVVVTRPSAGSYDAVVTITVTIGSDKLANDGKNYGAVGETRTFEFIVPARSSSGDRSGSTVKPPTSGEVKYIVSGSIAIVDMPTDKVNELIKDAKGGQVVLDLSKATSATSVQLPKAALNDIAKADLDITLELPTGTITLDNDIAASIVKQADGDDVKITINPVDTGKALNARQQAVVGDAPVYDITVSSNNQQITSFGKGLITISIPYTLKPDEEPAGVVVWYLDEDGNLERVQAMYDTRAKTVVFTIDHLSLYVIGYDKAATWKNPFIDVKEGDWFFDAVRFVSQNGMMKGTDTTTFAPGGTTTRGMIVTILHRLEGEPIVSGNPFSDVAAGQWYTNAVVWAAENEIVKGYGNDLFGPDDPITREQMAVILKNYAKFKGYDTSAKADLTAFIDNAAISSWAVDALSWANAEGLITGMGNSLLAPQGKAERAQVATILMRFI
ncbi:MAG: subtype B tannase, partial [Tepidanaerobacteraceae bacterium]